MIENEPPTATRKDLHLGRRFIHMASGIAVTLSYWLLFSHTQVVHLLGTIACIAYVSDRFRVAYPEIAKKFEGLTNFFLRAEERLKESAMIPYAIGILLTILSFPKPIALVAISTLAVADPLSAIIGIRFGKRHWVKEKTIEGSLAFFSVAFFCSFYILFHSTTTLWWQILLISSILSLTATAFEMLPIKLDDNLTIPIFVGFVGWALCVLLGLSFP
ncbi:MAG: hypothetical protein HQM15_07570 [Deltaproteobacteria bacterium]|nr:hypothetical protein [Deltaproteobacteria bacterium]